LGFQLRTGIIKEGCVVSRLWLTSLVLGLWPPVRSKDLSVDLFRQKERFPPIFSEPLLFMPQDSLNTDGIYPGKHTYPDDMTREKRAEVVMEKYETSFASSVRTLVRDSKPNRSTGDRVILPSGFKFSTSSSREQAATAILSSGIRLVICGSFGDIFKRNSINNALICIESPKIIEDLTVEFSKDQVRNKGGKNDGELMVQTQ